MNLLWGGMRKYDPADVLAIRKRFNLTIAQAVDMVCLDAVVPWGGGYGPEESRRRLDAIGKDIGEEGFSEKVISEIRNVVKEIVNGEILFERYPQSVLPGLRQGSEALVSAIVVCRGCPQTKSESRKIYDTDDLIGEGLIQENLVESWARNADYWLADPELVLSRLARLEDVGTESRVYFLPEEKKVLKLISLKHYNILRLALDRIVIHNAVFPFTAMNVFGFGRNRAGEFVVCVEQRYVIGVKPAERERADFMTSLGFEEAGEDYGMHLNYRTDELYIGDVNEYNVIKSGNLLHVIDADCRINYPSLGCGGKFSGFRQ